MELMEIKLKGGGFVYEKKQKEKAKKINA